VICLKCIDILVNILRNHAVESSPQMWIFFTELTYRYRSWRNKKAKVRFLQLNRFRLGLYTAHINKKINAPRSQLMLTETVKQCNYLINQVFKMSDMCLNLYTRCQSFVKA